VLIGLARSLLVLVQGVLKKRRISGFDRRLTRRQMNEAEDR